MDNQRVAGKNFDFFSIILRLVLHFLGVGPGSVFIRIFLRHLTQFGNGKIHIIIPRFCSMWMEYEVNSYLSIFFKNGYIILQNRTKFSSLVLVKQQMQLL